MYKNGTILIVDDAEENRMLLEGILEDKYYVLQADSGEAALELMLERRVFPDMILLDIMMPNMTGFELMDILKSKSETDSIPVIFITAADDRGSELNGLNAGAVDYIAKPFVSEIVMLRINNFMELMNYRKDLEAMVEKKVDELISTKDHMLNTMATIIEYRNLESGQHVKRTTELSRTLIDKMLEHPKYKYDLEALDYEVILKAAPMHDIGKIAIPDSILLKPSTLTAEEFEIIKTHTVVGAQIIESMMDHNKDTYFNHCHDIVLYHHERWNGTGYPEGLSGEDIPLSARVLALVDVYDALASERVYKKAVPHEEAVNIIKKGSGTQFDPDLVSIFLDVEDKFKDCITKTF